MLLSSVVHSSHYNVVGPTGALSGVLSQYSIRYGPGIQPILAILAGGISLAVWFLGLERFFVFIPSAVMHGFTLGVAFIICGNQLNFILGLPKLPRHEKFLDNIWESLSNIGQTSWYAVIFFAISFGALFILQKKFGKIPWSIILAMIGILIGWWQGDGGSIQTIASRYGNLEMQLIQISSVFTNGLDASFSQWMDLLTGSVSIAIIAVLETLISAHIADRMTK
jgi:sulfate permease, SulP family